MDQDKEPGINTVTFLCICPLIHHVVSHIPTSDNGTYSRGTRGNTGEGVGKIERLWKQRRAEGRKAKVEMDWEKGTWSLLIGCLMPLQHASVSQGRICSDNFTCCHTEIEVADPTFHLTQSQ